MRRSGEIWQTYAFGGRHLLSVLPESFNNGISYLTRWKQGDHGGSNTQSKAEEIDHGQ